MALKHKEEATTSLGRRFLPFTKTQSSEAATQPFTIANDSLLQEVSCKIQTPR